MIQEKDLTKVNRDVNGNTRYVLHYLELDSDYNKSVKMAKTLGGKIYRASWYGGGIVFQSNNTRMLVDRLNELVNNK